MTLSTTAQLTPAFSDDFGGGKLDTHKWAIATYQSPDSKPGINQGRYSTANVDLQQGLLCIRVSQKVVDGEVQSSGGAIISKDRFGFGTYEFEMRMSSTSPTPNGVGKPLTGAVSSGFLYYNKSETEIDLEFLGDQNRVWVTNWRNPDARTAPNVDDSRIKQTTKLLNKDFAAAFHTYTLVWEPERIRVFIDGALVTTHSQNVPQVPAYIILEHRGTNSGTWGGTATVGRDRYFYVRSVKFTPFPEKNK